jgi:hypothetical protein
MMPHPNGTAPSRTGKQIPKSFTPSPLQAPRKEIRDMMDTILPIIKEEADLTVLLHMVGIEVLLRRLVVLILHLIIRLITTV